MLTLKIAQNYPLGQLLVEALFLKDPGVSSGCKVSLPGFSLPFRV